jgi:DNA primase
MNIVEYLQSLTGTTGKRSNNGKWCFSSPFRRDTTPSFWVWSNGSKEYWKDYGTGEYGDYLDLIMKVESCTLAEARNKVGTAPTTHPAQSKEPLKKEKIQVQQIRHTALIEYAKSRGVAECVLRRYAVEVVQGKFFYLAMRNVVGGYAIRNRGYKGQIGNLSFSFFSGSSTLLVFEGMFDMLSYLSININIRPSVIVLNSVVNVPNAIEVMAKYNDVRLYLDNDNGGKTAVATILQSIPYAQDKSYTYADYNDVNDYIIGGGYKNRLFSSNTPL